MSDPTTEQVADALDTISVLHRLGYGAVTVDDQRSARKYRNRQLIGFFGLSEETALRIVQGMRDVVEVSTPTPGGKSALIDIYGEVLLMPVRLSLPPIAETETEHADETSPSRRPLFARLRRTAQYPARHRTVEP